MKRIKSIVIALAIALPAVPASAASLTGSHIQSAVAIGEDSSAQVYLANSKHLKKHIIKKKYGHKKRHFNRHGHLRHGYSNRGHSRHKYSRHGYSRYGHASGHKIRKHFKY